jgi:hypothetical protein
VRQEPPLTRSRPVYDPAACAVLVLLLVLPSLLPSSPLRATTRALSTGPADSLKARIAARAGLMIWRTTTSVGVSGVAMSPEGPPPGGRTRTDSGSWAFSGSCAAAAPFL